MIVDRDDKVERLILKAFDALTEAEKLVYAAGEGRDERGLKNALIEAHSGLLRAKNIRQAANKKWLERTTR